MITPPTAPSTCSTIAFKTALKSISSSPYVFQPAPQFGFGAPGSGESLQGCRLELRLEERLRFRNPSGLEDRLEGQLGLRPVAPPEIGLACPGVRGLEGEVPGGLGECRLGLRRRCGGRGRRRRFRPREPLALGNQLVASEPVG